MLNFDIKQYYAFNRPESNMLKNLPKMLPEISQKFTYYASQCSYYACIIYATKLLKILSIVMENLK